MIKNLEMPFKQAESVEINAEKEGTPLSYKDLNELIHQEINTGNTKISLKNVCGQRFIGAALSDDIQIYIDRVAGNDLGIFMDGPEIFVNGNCEDQAGNTMNAGKLVINGSTGDVTGLSARGGEIFIKGNVGFRVGIHMKEYKGQRVNMVVGGNAQDYLGEYMAGGVIIVLGLKIEEDSVNEITEPICGNCVGSGIHGGVIFLRTDGIPVDLLGIGAKITDIDEKDKKLIEQKTKEFCKYFNVPEDIIWKKGFKKIIPASKRPFASNYCKDII